MFGETCARIDIQQRKTRSTTFHSTACFAYCWISPLNVVLQCNSMPRWYWKTNFEIILLILYYYLNYNESIWLTVQYTEYSIYNTYSVHYLEFQKYSIELIVITQKIMMLVIMIISTTDVLNKDNHRMWIVRGEFVKINNFNNFLPFVSESIYTVLYKKERTFAKLFFYANFILCWFDSTILRVRILGIECHSHYIFRVGAFQVLVESSQFQLLL